MSGMSSQRRWRTVWGLGSIAAVGWFAAQSGISSRSWHGKDEHHPGGLLGAGIDALTPGPGLACRVAGLLDDMTNTDQDHAQGPLTRAALAAAGTRGVEWAASQVSQLGNQREAAASKAAVRRYFCRVFESSGDATVLQQNGVIPALLRLSEGNPEFAASLDSALSRFPVSAHVTTLDVDTVLEWLETTSSQSEQEGGKGAQTWFDMEEDPSWVMKLREGVARPPPSPSSRLALRALSAWAGASVLNCAQLATAGTGSVLPRIAGALSTTDAKILCELMRTLARNCPASSTLPLDSWWQIQLCLAADAVAANDAALVESALMAFASCLVRAGGSIQSCESLIREIALPLLARVAMSGDESTRRPVARVVRALASTGLLPADAQEYWVQTLLQWASTGAGDPTSPQYPSASEEEKRNRARINRAVIAALQSVTASQPSGAGLYAWLAEMIVTLSFLVHPLEASSQEKRRAEASAAEVTAGSWLWGWWRAAPMPTEEEDVQREQGTGTADGGSSSWFSFWRSSGTSQQKGSSVMEAKTEPKPVGNASMEQPRAPSDSDLSLYIHAAPVGPAFARAVAAELVQEGSAWDALPMDAGDDVMAAFQIAKREARRRFVSAVRRGVGREDDDRGDSTTALAPGTPHPAALAQALAVLSSLAADEHRRAWLLRMGVLPMLWQLNERLSAQEAGRWREPEEQEGAGSDVRRQPEELIHEEAQNLVESTDQAKGVPSIISNDQPTTQEHAFSSDSSVVALLDTARQTARLLALLSSDVRGSKVLMREKLPRGGWIAWLQAAATEDDCNLSSSAVKALLHLESAAATVKGAGVGEGLPGEAGKVAAAVASIIDRHRRTFRLTKEEEQRKEAEAIGAGSDAPAIYDDKRGRLAVALDDHKAPVLDSNHRNSASLLGNEGVVLMPGPAQERAARRATAVEGGEAPWSAPALAVEVLETVRAALESGARRPIDLGRRLVLRDGVHLFVPGDPQQEVLARCGKDCVASGSPAIDVVFVHGIRGGPFATWRQEGQPRPGRGRPLLHHACWPAAWLSEDLPSARLLTIEYAAPASGWEGEALPFQETVAQLAGMLLDAGVGSRPVVFVCHSMGGVIVKELLAEAYAQTLKKKPIDGRDWRAFACQTKGLVSFAVPHSGSRLADWGWRLRYVGGAPAGAVAYLKTTERHLEDVNAIVRGMYKAGYLDVLSFGEGKPMRVAYVKTLVVPLESAYPGYGEFHVLPSHDHISACKPTDRHDVTYARTLEFLRKCLATAQRQRTDENVCVGDSAAL